MKSSAAAIQLREPDPARPGGPPLQGSLAAPTDTALGHFGMVLAALAVGATRFEGMGDTADTRALAAALTALGSTTVREPKGTWAVSGRGIGGLREPAQPLDIGDSPQLLALLAGVLAGHPGLGVLAGTLPGAPVNWLAGLRQAGARLSGRGGVGLPLVIQGQVEARPLALSLPAGDSFLKQAFLLAGLCGRGETRLIETIPCPDHTEAMLTAFGAGLSTTESPEGRVLILPGQPELAAAPILLPGDASLAAIALLAAVLVPGSRLIMPALALESRHAALFEALRSMGAGLSLPESPWPTRGSVEAWGSSLRGAAFPSALLSACGPDTWLLAIAAAAAEGPSRFEGWRPDKALHLMLEGLGAGLETHDEDCLITPGPWTGNQWAGKADASPRLTMGALVIARARRMPLSIRAGSPIEALFPGFLSWLGAID